MGRVSASLELPYPADRVFGVATRVDDLPRWLPEVVEATLLDAPLAPGSRVRLKLSGAVAGAEVVGTVKQLRAPSSLVIGGSGGSLSVEVRSRLVFLRLDCTWFADAPALPSFLLLGFNAG